MNPMRAFKHPVAFAEQCIGLAALGAIWYWWLGVAESSTGRLLLSLVTLAAIIAGLWFLVRRGRARLAPPASERPVSGAALTAALLFAMSLPAAYWLIWWVPSVDSLRAQIASMALRFGAAFVLVALFWANLLAATAPRPGSSGRGETIEG